MKVSVYGAGALGTAVGALLEKAGEHVDLIDNNPVQIDALRTNGARIEGDENFTIPVTALYPQEATPGYDVIFLAASEKSNADALSYIKDLLKVKGILVSLQNGFTDNEIIEAVGPLRTMGCAVDWIAEQIEPGRVAIHSASGRRRAYIGKAPGVVSEPAMNARNLLDKIGEAHFISNLLGARWGKLVINCTLSIVSAIYGGTFGETVAQKECRDLMVRSGNECMKVAEAMNITIPNFEEVNFKKATRYHTVLGKWYRMRRIPDLIKYHKDAKSGLLQNLEAKKPLDLENITGVIIKGGLDHRVATPVNQTLQKAMLRVEKGDLAQGIDTIRAILKHI